VFCPCSRLNSFFSRKEAGIAQLLVLGTANTATLLCLLSVCIIKEYPEDSPEDCGMSSGEIDRLPVNQLTERYRLVRSAVYTRLDALGIKPERVGNKAYVNARQLSLLDELHQFIQSGGTTAEFLESRGIQKEEEPSNLSTGLSTGQPDIVQLVAAIAAQFASKLQPPAPEPDPFAYFETLERAARHGWLLSTSELAYLLDLLPSEIQQYGDHFSEAGFSFIKAGYRAGGEVAWRVSKLVK
jgi:hypothetical protein